ncbi:hypothetical protein EON67_11380, partial [archaeon]
TTSVTSPEHLAAELFTNKGAGTLVTRGERVLIYDTLEGVDLPRLKALVESAFRATLPDSYFASLMAEVAPGQRRLRRLFLSENYRGVAIVTEEAGLPGVAYLDKFAVAPAAQGDKLGDVLWQQMVSMEGGLYWRSRSTNRVNPWYYEQSSGCFKNRAGDWTVFWRDLDECHVMPAISTALGLAPTFVPAVYTSAAAAACAVAGAAHGSSAATVAPPLIK